MEKVFDAHVHYSFEMPLEETISIFQEEFRATGTERYAFMSLPHHAKEYGLGMTFDDMQNIKGLYLKHYFSPNAYAFAGLEHPLDVIDEEVYANELLKQAETYTAVGYDGIKMLEGYPSMRKAMKRKLCDAVYDKYYEFMEKKGLPIIMHVANPKENWDPILVSEYARSVGRYCDETFPTKEELHAEVEEIMKRFPKLKLGLAHFGFLTYDIEAARHFLDAYENTFLDITPGGEQYFEMLKDWESWHEFFIKNQDRIIYGTDFYAFPKDEQWEVNFKRRTNFVRAFLETDTEHTYNDEPFCGVKIERILREKIYGKNAVRLFGEPNKIDCSYIEQVARKLLNKSEHKDVFAVQDLQYILKNL